MTKINVSRTRREAIIVFNMSRYLEFMKILGYKKYTERELFIEFLPGKFILSKNYKLN